MERKNATAAYAVTVLDGRQIVNGEAFDAVVDRTDRTAKVTGSDGRQKLAERAFIAGWEAASMEQEAAKKRGDRRGGKGARHAE